MQLSQGTQQPGKAIRALPMLQDPWQQLVGRGMMLIGRAVLLVPSSSACKVRSAGVGPPTCTCKLRGRAARAGTSVFSCVLTQSQQCFMRALLFQVGHEGLHAPV